MNGLSKNIAITSLILATAGAILFCVFTGALVSGHEAHDNMPIGQSGVLAHALHAKELTIATITTTSLSSIIALILIVAFGVLFFFLKIGSLRLVTIHHFAQGHRDAPHIARRLINSWLALFEQSPNFIKPA